MDQVLLVRKVGKRSGVGFPLRACALALAGFASHCALFWTFMKSRCAERIGGFLKAPFLRSAYISVVPGNEGGTGGNHFCYTNTAGQLGTRFHDCHQNVSIREALFHGVASSMRMGLVVPEAGVRRGEGAYQEYTAEHVERRTVPEGDIRPFDITRGPCDKTRQSHNENHDSFSAYHLQIHLSDRDGGS